MPALFDILLIDDDKDMFHSIKNFAFDKGVKLRFALTLEDGLELLEKNNKILGIILDGKGIIKKTDSPPNPTSAFVHESILQIALLEQKMHKVWPKCVLTAFIDDLFESLDKRIPIFDKKKVAIYENERHRLFDSLIVQIEDSDAVILRKKYRYLFDLMMEKYVPKGTDNSLFKCLSLGENQIISQEDFNLIRSKLLEMILYQLNNVSSNDFPDILFHPQNKNPDFTRFSRYFKGMEIHDYQNKKQILVNGTENNLSRIPNEACAAFDFIKDVTNKKSHYDHHEGYLKHLYQACLYSWISFFLWYVSWVDKKIAENKGT